MTKEQELKELYGYTDQLEMKLREIKQRVSNIADECQYEHSLSDPIYLCLKSLINDADAWEV